MRILSLQSRRPLWQAKQTSGSGGKTFRLLAVLLAFMMILSPVPVPVNAEDNGIISEIIAFELPTDEVSSQTVPLGTDQSALNLPETLIATVRTVSEEEPEEPTEQPEISEISETESPLAESPETAVPILITSETDIPVSVTWEAVPEYDGGVPGEYVFTALVDGNFTVTTETPIITVTLINEQESEELQPNEAEYGKIIDEIIAFEPLPDEVARQTVPLGTDQSALNLPETLMAIVRVVSEEEAEETEKLATHPETSETDIPVSVIWEALPEYDGGVPGECVFTALVDGNFTVTANTPIITVTVIDEQESEETIQSTETVIISAFEALDGEILYQGYDFGTITSQDELTLPDTLIVIDADGMTIIVSGVEWGSVPSFDPLVSGSYIFSPITPEGFTCATGIEPPIISVFVRPEGGIGIMPMKADTDWYDNNPTAAIFTIATADELAALAELVNSGTNSFAGKTIILTADIDLTDYGMGYNSGKGWIPIGTYHNSGSGYSRAFCGKFDGANHKITGLYINDKFNNYAGLFGLVYHAEVKNLGVEGVDITGRSSVGAIAATIYTTNVTGCYSTGFVNGTDSGVGGIIGTAGGTSKISGCYSKCAVSSYSFSGGVAGTVNNSTLTNCYATGSVSSLWSLGSGYFAAGGIVGGLSSGSISNCYATGAIDAAEYAGGVAGLLFSEQKSAVVSNCAALNPIVMGGTNSSLLTGRVIGYSAWSNSAYINNYAFSGLLDTKNTLGWPFSQCVLNSNCGKDISLNEAKTNAFWTTASNWDTTGWDTDIWDIIDGRLPILKNVGGTQAEGVSGTVISVAIIPNSVSVQKGHQQIFIANVKGINDPAQTVTWTISGNMSNNTSISDGILFISNDETAGTLTVTATSTVDTTKHGTAIVTVKKENGVTVNAPILQSATHNSITINTVTSPSNGQSVEYSISTKSTTPGTWQDDLTFANLTENTTYYIFARAKENDLYNAGAYNVSTGITTLPTPSIGITLSVNGTYAFPNSVYNNDSQTPLTVTVTNIGNQSIGALTIGLSGTNADSFTLSKTSITNIAATAGNNTDTFTVVPGAGLAVGTYTATVTISGTNGISESFGVSFTVNPAPTYSASINPSNMVFASAVTGYEQQVAQIFTVTNNGTENLTNLTVSLGDTYFEISTVLSTSIISSGDTATISIRPMTDLLPNAAPYTDTLTIRWDNDGGIGLTVNLSFTVNNTTPVFVPVTDIINVPTTLTAGTLLNLTGTVVPSNATNQTIIWSVNNAGNTGAVINNGMLTATNSGTVTVTATVVAGLSASVDYIRNFTIAVVTATNVQTHTLTIQAGMGGSIIIGSDGQYAQGTVINISASPNVGYTFTGWTSSNGGVFGNPYGSSTLFTMPGNSTAIAAHFIYTGENSGPNIPATPVPTPVAISTPTPVPTLTLPTPAQTQTSSTQAPTLPTPAPTSAEPTSVPTSTSSTPIPTSAAPTPAPTPDIIADAGYNQDGDNVTLTDNKMKEIISNAEDGTAIVDLSKEVGTESVTITKSMLNSIKQLKLNIEFILPVGSIKFGQTAAGNIVRDSQGSSITISIKEVKYADLKPEQASKVGDRPVYELTVRDANKRVLTNFGGNVEVTLPYSLKPGEDPNAIVVYHVSAEGTLNEVPNCRYENGTIIFTTTHFYMYMIGYNSVTFDDIKGHWGQKAIEQVAARKLVSGYDNGLYMPDKSLTRAEFVAMVCNVLTLPNPNTKAPFYADISTDKWFYNAVASAKQEGLLNRLIVRDNAFMPNQEITRQEVALILANVAMTRGMRTTVNADIKTFSDLNTSDVNYHSAIKVAIDVGLLDANGMGGGKFAPTGAMTRAQAAQMQINLLNILGKPN